VSVLGADCIKQASEPSMRAEHERARIILFVMCLRLIESATKQKNKRPEIEIQSACY